MRHRSAASPSASTPSPRSRRVAATAAALALLAASGVAVAIGTSSASPGNLLSNAGFEHGFTGWHRPSAPDHVAQVRGGHSGSYAAKLTTNRAGTVAIKDSPNAVTSTRRGDVYAVSAWVRSTTPAVTAQLRVREVRGGAVVDQRGRQLRLADKAWHKISFTYTAVRGGDALDFNVLALDLGVRRSLLVDDTWLSLTRAGNPTGTSSPTASPHPSSTPTGSGGGGSGTTLFGSSIHRESGETFASAYQRRVRAFGSLPVDRVFYTGLPQSWPGSAGYGGRPVVVSFHASPQTVLTGRYDAQLARWFASAPRDRAIYWAYFHEPEDNIEARQFTAAQFRAAYARISGLADRAGNPQLHATLVLMCFTLNRGSNRSFADYYPGAAAVDVLAFDCYNGKASSGAYIDPSVQFQQVLDVSASTGKPFGVAEFGSELVRGDSGARRAAWMRLSASYLAAHHAKFVTWFDSPVGPRGDYRLRDAASIAAWRDCVTRY